MIKLAITWRLLLAAFVGPILGGAAASQQRLSVMSPFVHDVCLRVSSFGRPPGKEDGAERLIYGFMCRTNRYISLKFPRPEYFCQVDLVDSDGKPVAKTRLGKRLGAKFWELRVFKLEDVEEKTTAAFPDVSEGHFFYGVEELFKISKPGDYRLKVRMQVFKMWSEGTNTRFKLVVLPVVEYPVVFN